MNVSQALEYERQPFIPMFIYGDHGAMESERQKGEEALKVLETEYFTAEGDPGFDFAPCATWPTATATCATRLARRVCAT